MSEDEKAEIVEMVSSYLDRKERMLLDQLHGRLLAGLERKLRQHMAHLRHDAGQFIEGLFLHLDDEAEGGQ